MPRFKQIAEIQQLMHNKESIRNIGIIAHIDHGKTTLADSFLAGAGLLSQEMAGTARVLDYLDEEQKRKITIKTANISLLCKLGINAYVINLIDTPGHVDFTGKVTRALRIIDGVVVVVDAVEEIMAQTETLTRQALEERVRPVLFINKIDRLINELQLNEEQIQQKLNRLISAFNDLVELYAEDPYRSEWKISALNNNVAFGAALHGWGFTLDMARLQNLKFPDIIKACVNGEHAKLKKKISVFDAILDMAIKQIPNPHEAQQYRIAKIWDGHVGSKVGKALTRCSDDKPAIVYVTNIHTNSNEETLVTGRLFSGRVKAGDRLHLVDTLEEVETKKVAIEMGSFREDVNEVFAGNPVSLTLAGKVGIGHTLVDLEHKKGMVPFEGISYVSEPVVTLAVEPKNLEDTRILLNILERLAAEDPNLKTSVEKQTGEYLLSGMGELHLEIAISDLKNIHGIDVTVSSPRVVYREGVQKNGEIALAKSTNKLSSFWVQVTPETEEQNKLSQDNEIGNIIAIDEHRNVLIDCKGKTESVSEDALEAIIAGFEYACKAGPLCSEPMRHVKVNLIDFELGEAETLGLEIMRGVGKAIFGSFLTANPVLMEPIYKIVMSVTSSFSGECSRLLNTKRGKVTGFEQKELLTKISGFIPVSETFKLSKELRSATSGRVFWQSFFDHWEKMPPKLVTQVIHDLRQRKGLSPEVPKPEKFMEI